MKNYLPLNGVELAAMLERAVLTQVDIDNFNRLHQMPLEHTVDVSHLTDTELSVIHNALPSLFSENRRIKQVMQYKHRAIQDICIHDFINFTFKEETIRVNYSPLPDLDYEFERDAYHASSSNYTDFIHALSLAMDKIFGYGISTVRNNGINFYDRSFELGDGYGYAAHGGQNNTVLISITGIGCAQASEGWQYRLYQFLLLSIQPSITRVDLAHDDFNAVDFDISLISWYYEYGAFTCYRKPPQISYVGDFFSQNDTKGRTIYIGSRGSDKYFRGYEKGKQLQSLDRPNWFRCEVEFHNRDTIIDLDVLINPHFYFAGAYPIFNDMANKFERFESIQHSVVADVTHRVFHAKRQAGSVINLLIELGYSRDQVMTMLLTDKLPKKFVRNFLDNPNQSIHENTALVLNESNLAH